MKTSYTEQHVNNYTVNTVLKDHHWDYEEVAL